MQNSTSKFLFGINKFPVFRLSAILTPLLFFFISTVVAQTPGLIYEPATGPSRNVLDLDLNGFTSKTTAGFIGDDQLDSEIPYASLVFPQIKLTMCQTTFLTLTL